MRKRAWLVLLLLPVAPVRSGEGEVRLLTDDAIPRYLARGQVLARNEEWEKVVDVLHRVVIGDKEVFPDLRPEILHSAVYSDDGQLFYPARELCLKELAKLPPDGLRAYRNAHDREARELYARADSVADLEERLTRYAEVYDKFLPSSVGDDALEKAGDINLALGRYYEALALFRRLIDVYPKDTDRQLAMVFAKAAYCAARIGDREHRNVLLERLASEYADARLRLEGKPVRAAELREHDLLKVRGGAGLTAEADWPLPGGNATRARVAPDLPADLPRTPLWSFRLRERDARLGAPYGIWLVQSHDREPAVTPSPSPTNQQYLRPYPTVRPVVHDGLVFYKDYVETVARRIGSGTMAFFHTRYDPAEALADPRYLYPLNKVRPGSQGNPADAQKIERVYRHFDYGGNTVVIGDRQVIVVEQRSKPNGLLTDAPLTGRPNLLVAYARSSGKTTWAWHMDWCAMAVRRDAAAYEAWQRDFQNHSTPVFQGPGVIAGGILYTIAHEKEELAGVSLWAINVRDGRVRFRTPLHYTDEMRKWVPRGASVAVAGGVVYVVTHAGVVAAVDALPPGRVRWIRRYRRNYLSRRGRKRGSIQQGFAYNDPLVSGGKVIVMAADAEEVVALDAETGRIAWTHSKQALGNLAHIVGVADGVLVIAGDQVLALDLARGEKVWGPERLFGWPHGRGLVGARFAYLPTHHKNTRRSYVERFDLINGSPAPKLEFDVPQLGNLVISNGRLVAANGEEVMCFTTQAAELDRIDARIAKDGATSALLLERGLIALAGDTPRRDRARADFRRALDAAADERVDDRAIRAYAIENLFAIADKGSDLAALDEARGLVGPMAANRLYGDDGRHHPYEAQIALARVELLGRVGRGEEALGALERFLDLHGREQVKRDRRVLDGAIAAGLLRDHLLAASTAFRVAFEKSVRGRIQAALKNRDKEALRTIPERYEFKPPSEEAYFAHARLCEENGELSEAERVLRGFITRFKSHRRRASAHLHLSRILLRQAKPLHARRERYEGISRLDEMGRAENAKLLRELDELLASGEKPRPQPRIRIPLASRELPIRSATPVPIEGDLLGGLPEGYALFSGPAGYFALDGAGKVLWTQPDPTGGGASAGPQNEPDTLVIAAAIAAARLAVRDGDDLILGDVAGLMRLNARTGKVSWRYPARVAEARTQADQSIALLYADLRTLRKSGHLLRRHPLPAHALGGGIVVRVHPMTGLDGLDTRTGRTVLFDPDARGVPVGPPAVMGELLAVGWSKPGRVRVYHMQTGKRINDLKPGVLFAPPVIDPLGRVVVISADRDGRPGDLSLVNARLEEPAHAVTYRVPSTNAATLYADGKLVVYHDGSSGTKNLHFLDLEKRTRESYAAADLMRDFRVLRDGSRLFVFTCNPGLEDEGARLFRIDIPSREVLSYNLELKAHAYSRPVVTQRYIALAASLPRSAHVRLFDRDASPAGRGPYPVFQAADGKETATLDFRPQQGTNYGVPPALARSGEGFVVGHPFSTARLLARDAR
jgi:outer membrane protein assembly factor BamB/tetratricopeptide (TPR) repeat protein